MIFQVAITGARVLGRSFAEAYKQAQASSKYQAAAAKAGHPSSSSSGSSSRSTFSSGMTLDEATKILNVKELKGAETDMAEVTERFKRLFDANDPKKGGSFYLQSKVLRARERIEAEVAPFMEQKAADEGVKEGLPKMYKDR
ncbi:mitochondrial import inner membrane translocase subunit tim16 [Zalerion maritima]|uniref:Mitochondrial import inner membrane translocase subunit TIM16 n=1 Tax=Zalerion maritima TaxID=339359 RepID=A0AAD5RLZ7_9PEZI|nr:mitochondrial import inner membrane translocase subunit tim16 [Zalerion maritima]